MPTASGPLMPALRRLLGRRLDSSRATRRRVVIRRVQSIMDSVSRAEVAA